MPDMQGETGVTLGLYFRTLGVIWRLLKPTALSLWNQILVLYHNLIVFS